MLLIGWIKFPRGTTNQKHYPDLQSWTNVLGTVLQSYIFLSFLRSLLKQCILFEIFLQFSLPPPYKKLKLEKNSGYTRPTLFVGWREGLDLCELENTQKRKRVPRLLSIIVGSDASSVWNFCGCFSDAIWRGNKWKRLQMWAVFSGYYFAIHRQFLRYYCRALQ